MASILQIGDRWRAQVRRQNHRPQAKTFRTKAEALAWARQVESLTADATLLSRLDVLDAMIARCRADALRVEVEGARLRGLIAQAALHGQ